MPRLRQHRHHCPVVRFRQGGAKGFVYHHGLLLRPFGRGGVVAVAHKRHEILHGHLAICRPALGDVLPQISALGVHVQLGVGHHEDL